MGLTKPLRLSYGSPKFTLSLIQLAIFLSFSAQSLVAHSKDLVELSLEELANIQVTSVSKRSESINDAAASIVVISNEEIQRSGVSTLQDALRLAPNLQVAQDTARNYAITDRGFNSILDNKLLVLIDGRSIYTPLFSGVFWDSQDVVLEDIDRVVGQNLLNPKHIEFANPSKIR